MAETLEAFLGRKLRDVTETGKSCRTVRLLIADSGQLCDRWNHPLSERDGGPGADKLGEEIDDLCRGYAESFPSGVHMMLIIAEDGDGNEMGRHFKKVTGANKNAKSTMMGGDISIAEGARIHVDTTARLLNISTSQNALLMQQNKALLEQVQALMLIGINDKMRNLEELAERQSNGAEIDGQTKFILDKLSEIAGPFAEMFGPAIVKAISGPKPQVPAPQAPTPPPLNGSGQH